MNNIVVAKFGGTSLADAEHIRMVKDIILSDPNRRYIIPSAPGKRNKNDYKITDLFYLCHAHVEQGIPFNDVFSIIEKRYNEIVENLHLELDIQSYLNEIRNKMQEGVSRDYLASRGEYLNGLIISNYLNYEFIDAAELIFFTKYGNVDSKRTQEAFNKRLSYVEKAVIPGFYGNYNDKIKTFSRGGSDITGSIVAKCVHADLYENWTDVSGFLMADPRIVENPKPIEKITYRELRELSYMGATVLHEEAIFPVRKSGIPIKIKNTMAPSDPGTLIVSEDEDVDTKKGYITGVTGKRGFTVIAIEKTLMNIEQGFCRKLLSILETNGVSFENMPSGIDSVSLVIADTELENKLENIIEEINRQCNPDSIEIYPDMALVATVGRGMAKYTGTSGKIFGALAKEKVNIRMINQGSSEINIIVGVENCDFEKAIKAIYNAFQD